MKKEDRTTILISRQVKHFLALQANKKGETYDQILRRLLIKVGAKFEVKEDENTD